MTSSNSIFSTEYYNPWAEHSQEDIIKAKRWAEEEQKRRIEDTVGEQQRRYCGNQVAEIVSSTLRPNWFQKGSANVLNILKVARKAGNNLLRSSQLQASIVSAKFQVAGQKSVNTAQNVAHSIEGFGHKIQETAQDAKLKVEEAGNKAQETSKEVKSKLQETAHNVATSFEEFGQKIQGATKAAGQKVQEAAEKFKRASLKFFGKVGSVFSKISENSGLAFAVLEEENERAWRLTSETEVFAILNALAISSLFKEMAPAFYRPAFEPSRKYLTKLLEEYESKRRTLQDLSDPIAKNNAKAISGLITGKFSADAAIAAEQKHEIIEKLADKEEAERIDRETTNQAFAKLNAKKLADMIETNKSATAAM